MATLDNVALTCLSLELSGKFPSRLHNVYARRCGLLPPLPHLTSAKELREATLVQPLDASTTQYCSVVEFHTVSFRMYIPCDTQWRTLQNIQIGTLKKMCEYHILPYKYYFLILL